MPLELRPALTDVEKNLHITEINKNLNSVKNGLRKAYLCYSFDWDDGEFYALAFTQTECKITLDGTILKYSWMLEGSRLILLRSAHGRCAKYVYRLCDLVQTLTYNDMRNITKFISDRER